MQEEIRTLFSTRDAAAAQGDRAAFLSTQVAEIEGGDSDNYLGIGKMRSEVLHVHAEGSLEAIVLVKETYQPAGVDPYSSFPVYFLVKTVEGWKIYKAK